MAKSNSIFDAEWVAHGCKLPPGQKIVWSENDKKTAEMNKELAAICLTCKAKKCVGNCERYKEESAKIKKRYIN